MIRTMMFAAVVFGLFVQAPQAEETVPSLELRGWQFHHRDGDYLARAIPVAAAHGVNHVQLSHNIVHNIEDLLRHPERVELVNAVTRQCHEHGMEVFLWTHEFNDIPGDFLPGGKAHLDEPEIWNWMRGKYDKAFALAPDVDGLILTFHETNISVYMDDRVVSSLTPSQRVTQQIDYMAQMCRDYGKKLWVRTFVHNPDELDWVIRGISNADPSVPVMTKVVPHDWHPFYPDSPAIGRFPGRLQAVELDPGAEYYGQSKVPYNQVSYFKRRLDYAYAKGVRGAVARAGRLSNPVLGSMNEVNLYALSRYWDDMRTTPDTVWRDWTRKEFGPEAAQTVELAYRRTFDIITRTYLTQRFYFLNEHSRVPGLGFANDVLLFHSVAKWDPAYKPIEERLVRPNANTHREVVDEKAIAVMLAERSLADIEPLREVLSATDFARVHDPLAKLHRTARLWKALADVYFRYRITLHDGDPQLREALRNAAADTLALAGRIALEAGDQDAKWESAKRTRRFVETILEDTAERYPGFEVRIETE